MVFQVGTQLVHQQSVTARCTGVLLDPVERGEQIASRKHLLPYAPVVCVGWNLVSCRRRLGSLQRSDRLHRSRRLKSVRRADRRPSLRIPRTAQVHPLLTFSPSQPMTGVGTTASADPCRLSRLSQGGLPMLWPDGRSPQISALTFPAPWPDLPLCPLMARTSWLLAHSSGRTASHRVRVPPGAVLPPASFGPRLTTTPLP